MRIQIYLNKLDPGGCASLRERRWAFLSLKYNVVKLGTVYTKTKHAVNNINYYWNNERINTISK